MTMKRLMTRRLIVLAGIAMALIASLTVLTGCGEDVSGDRLVILSPHWEGIQDEFEHGFREYWREKTGNDVQFVWLDQGGTSQIMRYIRSEFTNTPDGIGADLLFGGGLDPFLRLSEAELLEPYVLPDSIMGRIPETFAGIPLYDTSGHWYGAAMSGFGIIYNSAVARMQSAEPPTTWEDMAKPEFTGWIAAGDPRTSGSIHMAYEIMLQAYGWQHGWEIITAMCANSRAFARSAGDIPLAISRADAVAGMAIDFYAWSEITKSDDQELGFVYPEDRKVINPDGIGILKGAPNLDIAQEFVAYVVGEPGQRIWAFKLGAEGGPKTTQITRFTVMPDLYESHGSEIAVDINPFEWDVTFHYNDHVGSMRYDLINDMIGSMMIDSHRELVPAWTALRERGVPAEGLFTLAYPPISEEQAEQLAARWRDQGLRNQLISTWTQFARRRYDAVKNGDYGAIPRPPVPGE